MVARIVLASIVLSPALANAGAGPTVSAQPALAPQVEQVEPPPAAAIPLAPPSLVAPRDPAKPPTAASSQWYGWQILLSDAAVFSFAGLTNNPVVAYGWIGSGAIVHLGHGNIGRGMASAALRVGLPLAGVFLGVASAGDCHGDWCGFGEALAGGAIGLASAELIDVVLLAHESAPSPATASAARRSHGVEISPIVRAGRSGFDLDLVGRF
jgi:hypothetical protein